MAAIILDCETTGTVDPEPVEVAWMLIERPGLGYTRDFCGRYKPTKPITLGAKAVHGITEADLEGFSPFASLNAHGAEYMIGHNVDFDWKAVGSPPMKRICTMALCRHFWPDADSHSLAAMIWLHCGDAAVLLRKAHSAWADVQNTHRILTVILHAIGDRLETWEEVWACSEEARVPKRMPFGKWKDTPIADVPADYKRWLLKQPNVDEYLQAALRG